MPYSRTRRANLGEPLDQREIEALELLCKGLEGVQIAARQGCDPSTVCHRLKLARDKLGAATLPGIGGEVRPAQTRVAIPAPSPSVGKP